MPNKRRTIIWTHDGLVYWCIYAIWSNSIFQNYISVTTVYGMTIPHYNDVIMGAMASKSPASRLFTRQFIDQRKHQSSAPLAFVRGIHRGPVNSPYKGPVTRKMFPFADVIMWSRCMFQWLTCFWPQRAPRAHNTYVEHREWQQKEK